MKINYKRLKGISRSEFKATTFVEAIDYIIAPDDVINEVGPDPWIECMNTCFNYEKDFDPSKIEDDVWDTLAVSYISFIKRAGDAYPPFNTLLLKMPGTPGRV